MQKISAIAQKVIEYSFYLLFFLTPLVFYSKNYELFEYNKMVLTYTFTIIITCAWLIKIVGARRVYPERSRGDAPLLIQTPFDKLLLLFLISQILSTIFSIDVHVSIFGYYSRFHQGLLATVSYLILYFAFTSNFPKEKIKNIIYASFASAVIVAIWGILEHYGHSFSCFIITGQFDVNCWVQDVQTRVFATLGQPNWMSAYLAIIIPISLSMSLRAPAKQSQPKNNFPTGLLQLLPSFAMTILFYFAFLFTRSRSGFVALWITLAIFIIMSLRGTSETSDEAIPSGKKATKSPTGLPRSFQSLAMTFACLLFITFIFGSGIAQIDKFTLVQTPNLGVSTSTSQGPALESGGTESGIIRKIVWTGALDIFRHYPLFGSGVETFAFSYYQYRPIEHNMVSEWDFLYNKAHNEYLNFLATTGIFGFITYLSFIIAFIIWFFKNVIASKAKQSRSGSPQPLRGFAMTHLDLALFCGWLTILFTNFFGFSVVVVALYFYLIPALVFVLNDNKPSFFKFQIGHPAGPADADKIGIIAGIIAGLFLFYKLINFYLADIDYAAGSSYTKNQKPKEAYLFLSNAIEKNPLEPIYHDETSTALAALAVSFALQNDEESAKKFASLALKESDIATKISPNNVTFYKTKTKMYYTLSQIDQSFIARTIDSLNRASELAPTDPKIKYNLSLLYSKNNDLDRAVKIMEEAVRLKPDYRDSRYALALFYKDQGLAKKAIEQLNYILEKINPSDTEAKEKLNSWQ